MLIMFYYLILYLLQFDYVNYVNYVSQFNYLSPTVCYNGYDWSDDMLGGIQFCCCRCMFPAEALRRKRKAFAAQHLPADVGNEFGEPVIAERTIRISAQPGQVLTRVRPSS